MIGRSWYWLLCAGCYAAALAGCGPTRTTELVEGTVIVDGAALADIRVTFQPQAKGADGGTGSYGITDASGRFTLKFSDNDQNGAMVGVHTVTLSDKKSEIDMDAGGAPPPSRIPAKYLTKPITFEVKAGQKNDAKLELGTTK